MKKLTKISSFSFLTAALIISISAVADEYPPQSPYPPQQVPLESPRDPQSGRLFNENSDPDGVCHALGYMNGVYGSVVGLSPDYNNVQDTLYVDNQGNRQISNGYGIWKITCRGNPYNQNPPPPSQYQLESPRDPQSGRLFNEASDVDGVCRTLGYENGVSGSVITLSSEYNNIQDTLYIDNRGYQSVANGYGIWKITCRGNSYVPPNPYLHQDQLDSPRDPFNGRLFSERSDVNSVCRVLGYANGAFNSVVALDPQYNNQQDLSLIDQYGSRQVVMGYGIWKITCRR